jgi:hypothetical protein
MVPPPLPEGPSWDGTEYLYEGLGQVLTTQEYSTGTGDTLFVSDLDNGETSSGQINIPQGWTGYELSANVFNLFDNISHIEGSTQNGNFETGTTSPTFWAESKRGMSGSGLVGIDWFYGPTWGETGDGVAVLANCTSYNWISNATYIEYVGWTQTIDLNRIDATSATLSFDVQFYDDGIHGRDDDDEMSVYAEVGGAERHFVCHRYALNAYRGGWGFHSIEFSLSVDELNAWTSDTINVTVGMTVDFDWTINNVFYMDFDNVKLVVRGQPSPTNSAIQLRLNSTNSWSDTSYGSGTITLTGTWGPYAADHNIAVVWSTTASRSRNVDFNYTLTLSITRSGQTESQTGPEGSAFWAKQGSSVYWTTWFFADFYPIYYENYNFTIQKPGSETWTLSSAIDPNLQDQTGSVTEDGSSVSLASTISAFGWWNFTFSSTNRVTSITGLASSYNIGDTLNINVNHNTVTSGQCNITIYDWNQQVVHEESKSLSGSTIVSFSKLFDSGDNFAAGLYTICATYDNGATGAMTSAGFYSAQFEIIHDTTLTIELGAASKTVIREPGSYFIRLTYDDVDKAVNPYVANTTGKVQINGTVNGNFIVFREYGNLYQAEINSMLLPVGDHIFTITGDEPYHNSATDWITLVVRSDATLTSPESPGLTIPYDETFTVQVYYNGSGGGISGATVTAIDWPTTPSGVGNGTAGWYDITFDTADQPGPGTYSVTIRAQQTNYVTRTVVLTIVVREISTTLDYTSPGSVPWDEDVQVEFSFFANDADSTAHDGDPITSATFTFQLDGGGLSQGTDYTLTNHMDGTYTLTLLASSGKISTIKNGYELIIQGDPSSAMFADASRTVYFNVRSLNTLISYIPPAPEPWGTDIVITLNFTVDDPDSSVHNGENIPGLLAGDVSLWLDGSPLVSFGWTALGGGQYNLTIYTSSISSVKVYSLLISVTHSSASYQSAQRTVSLQVLTHQTQTIVDQPDPTAYGQQTSVTITWRDLDTATDLTDTELDYLALEFINGTGLPNETSLSFTLDTSTWNPGAYEITVTAIANSDQYLQSSGTLRITILIHQTAVTVLPPEATPWQQTTDITIQWFDLTAGGQIDVLNVSRIVISGAVSDTINNPTSWTITVDTSGLAIGIHSLTISIEAKTGPQIYANSAGDVDVNIRRHRVYVLVTGPAPIPEGGSIRLSVSWTDLDTGLPIDNATYLQEIEVTQITGPTAPTLPWYEFNNLDFTISAVGWGRGSHELNVQVTANSPNFDVGNGSVIVIIRIHSIIADVDPIPRVPVGNDWVITLRVNDSDDAVGLPVDHISSIIITGGAVPINLDSGNWGTLVTNITDGIYEITLEISSWPRATYTLQFSITTSNQYGNGVVYTQLIIRQLATSFTYTSPPVVPFGEDGALIVTYLVDDPPALNQDGDPITGTITITIAGLTRYTHFDWVYLGSGQYNITFYGTYLDNQNPPYTYLFDITISESSGDYRDGQLDDVPLDLRTLVTWLHPTAVPLTPYGDDVVIDVAFEVLDGESSQNGDRIPGATIRVNVSNLVYGLDYTVTWDGGSEIYQITIFADVVNTIRWYQISVETISVPIGYSPDTIARLDFRVRTMETTLQVEIPDPEPWGDNFIINIVYSNNDPDSSTQGEGLPGLANNITLIGFSFTIQDLGLGNYRITVNSSIIGSPLLSPHFLTIATAWTQTPSPYSHETKLIQVTINERPTENEYTPGGEYGYADNITISFTYIDTARGNQWIRNTSLNVLVMVYWKSKVSGQYELLTTSVWYTSDLSAQPYAFLLEIEADFYGVVDTFYDFRVWINWTYDTQPYYLPTSFEFRAYVSGQPTDVILQPTGGATPIGDIMTFQILYQTEAGNPIDNSPPNDYVHLNLTLQNNASFGIWMTHWWYTNDGNGYYTIHIDTNQLSGIDTYLFILNVTYEDPGNPTPSPFYQSHHNLIFPMEVREIDTILIPEQLDRDYYWGEDIYINITFWDRDHNIGVLDPITISVNYGGDVTEDPSIESYPGEDGKFKVTFSTSTLPAGAYVTFTISASKHNYNDRDVYLSIYLEPLPIYISIDSIITHENLTADIDYVEQYYANMVTFNITIRDIWGRLVNDSSASFLWAGTDSNFVFIANGTYTGILNGTHDVGRELVEIHVWKDDAYANSSHFTFVIKNGPSSFVNLSSLSPIVYVGEIMNVTVQYTTGIGNPISGADVFFDQAFIGSITLIEIGSTGIYTWTDNSASFGIGVYTIQVRAQKIYLESQVLVFVIEVKKSDAELVPVDIPANHTVKVQYLENFNITVVMWDKTHNLNVSEAKIQAIWEGYPIDYDLDEYTIGYSFYTLEFPANLSEGVWDLTLRWISTTNVSGFDCDSIIIRVTILERQTVEITLVEAVAVYGYWNGTHIVEQWSTTVPLNDLEVPYGDFLYLYFNWTAEDGSVVEFGGGLATVGTLSVDITYDTLRMIRGRTGYYLLILNSTRFGFGPKGISVEVTKPNFEPQPLSTGFTVIEIPMALSMVSMTGYASLEESTILLYVGSQFECIVNLTDTWHGWGVTDADIIYPEGAFTDGDVIPLDDGLYRIVVLRGATETTLVFEISAQKTNYLLSTPLQYEMQIRFSPLFVAMTQGITIGVAVLIIGLLGWILWSRVYSIPWEVRRMRKLAKTVEKDEGYQLSGKDLKKFHHRGIILEDKMDSAMTPIGVAATPAMIPTTEEVEEVTATEEDIITELDKIPGLGPEEKAVLAEEMRKIPRKDRIWFLDDLRRQMGQRRMDFLTQREPTPTPEAPPEPAPSEVPSPEDEAPVLEEVKPEEPPPAMTEDRTAPTVLPPELQPAPRGDPKVIAEIRRELSKIPGLSEEEKDALVDHLQYLSKEERQSTYRTLRMSANEDK